MDGAESAAARVLVDAFYEALGADTRAVTTAMRRRDLVIARGLVHVGAIAAEAAAYARDASAANGRIAPVDLRSFERERLGWLARRRAKDLSERRVVDRTGQPPAWERALGESSSPFGRQAAVEQPEGGVVSRTAESPGLAGTQLVDKLRLLFGGAGQ